MKPREWKLNLTSKTVFDVGDDVGYPVHVIEKSAYDEMLKRCNEIAEQDRKEYADLLSEYKVLRANNKELADQRFDLMERVGELEKRLSQIRDSEHSVKELEAKLKMAVEALNRVSAHGLHHYEDCLNHNYDDETCDCGMENALNLVVKALKKIRGEE